MIKPATRALVAGFAATAMLFAGAGRLAAAAALASHDSDAPVDFAADHMELQDKQKRVLLSGHVDVTQAELRLTADRTLMAYTDESRLTVHRIDATGGVVVTRRDERAAGDVAVYDLDRKLITMIGHVALTRANGDTLNGGRPVSRSITGISSIDGHTAEPVGTTTAPANGRVSGTFNVPKKDANKP